MYTLNYYITLNLSPFLFLLPSTITCDEPRVKCSNISGRPYFYTVFYIIFTLLRLFLIELLKQKKIENNETNAVLFPVILKILKKTTTKIKIKNDVIHNIEVKVGRPMQWFICLLHFSELSYAHFFQNLDGETSYLHVSPGKLTSG